MTKINPHLVLKEELEARYWMNQVMLPPAPDDIYNIYFLDKKIRVKKADDYPFGSVKGFVDEQEVMEKYFYPYMNREAYFVDVGACWGTYSLRALAMGAAVVAFEPDPRMIKGLKDNISINPGFENRFILCEMAVANGDFIADEIYDLSDVPIVKLDSMMIMPTFIKIDVEGMESLVIEGAMKTLKEYKPKLLIENHAYMGDDRTQEIADTFIDRTRKMVSMLTSLGYKFEMGPEAGRTYFTFCY